MTMRPLLTMLILITILSAKAQSHLPIYSPAFGFIPHNSRDSAMQNRKWQVVPFASVSAGFIFLNGGISYFSAPVGLALIHPLNNNWSAFGSVSATPVIFSVNRLYTDPGINGANQGGFSRPYNLGLNAQVSGGLMYTNDAKTFSISGSVGIEKGSYPVYPSNSNRPNTKKP
jgi:hypothetical protein